MSEMYQSLSHSKWDCKYHIVFVPKYRRKVMFGEIRKFLEPIFHELARQKECRIIEGHLMPDHVHMCIEIPPKYSVASVIGFIKGKSAIAIARQFKGKRSTEPFGLSSGVRRGSLEPSKAHAEVNRILWVSISGHAAMPYQR